MLTVIWTEKQPTTPGWYWTQGWPITDKDTEWAGPIPEPKNPHQ